MCRAFQSHLVWDSLSVVYFAVSPFLSHLLLDKTTCTTILWAHHCDSSCNSRNICIQVVCCCCFRSWCDCAYATRDYKNSMPLSTHLMWMKSPFSYFTRRRYFVRRLICSIGSFLPPPLIHTMFKVFLTVLHSLWIFSNILWLASSIKFFNK